MKVIVEHSDTLPLVDLYIIAHTGSATDPEGAEGALNLAMRTLRRGTAKRSGPEMDAAIDRLGAEFSTLVDATSAALHVTVLKRNVGAMVDLVLEMLREATFAPESVAQVSREIIADLHDSLDDDRTLAGRHFRRTLFAGHPFGRPIAGRPSSLKTLDREAIVAAWLRTFRRENITIAAAGDISPAEVETLASRIENALTDGIPTEVKLPEPTAIKGRHLVIVDKPERTQTQVYIGSLGTHPKDKDHSALIVGNTIFGGTFTSRLTREVRSKRGWSYGVSSRLGRERVRDSFSMWSIPSAKDAAACVALELKLLEGFVKDGVSARETAFAQSYLTRGAAFDVDTATKRLWRTLDERFLGLKPGWHDRHLKRIAETTHDEVNAAVARRLHPKDLIVCVVATADELRDDLAAVARFASVTVIPYDTE